MNIRNFIPRQYQENILETAKVKNTLVVLPTGTGKTKIAILLAVNRLNNFPNSKILICTPTKPLSNQIFKEFIECTTISKDDILLLTGAITPEKRKNIWETAKIIVATPQTIQSDIENNRISLQDFSMLCLDEAHRSRLKYAHTKVANEYIKQARFPRILALTASPGGTKERIEEICKNLLIEAVEIRSSIDEDVKEYIQEKEIEWVEVYLPEEYKQIRDLIKNFYILKLKELKKFGLSKPLNLVNKRDLLSMQNELRKNVNRGNPAAFYGISLVAQLIKLSYALELLETQGIVIVREYWKKLLSEKTKAANVILNNKDIAKAISLCSVDIKHPKVIKLCSIVEQQIKNNPASKIIIFANFRNTIKEIIKNLKEINNIYPVELVGQKEGITQKIQIETIKQFGEGKYNILVTTSIGEEGLHIASADIAIFYEPIASEIRVIQRMGRVGRISKGKVIILITRGTRDEAYYWSAKHKEKIMRKTLYKMKQHTLEKW